MVNDIINLRHYIRCDLRSRGLVLTVVLFFRDPITRFILALRINEYLLNRGFGILFRAIPVLYFRRLSIRLGFSIPPNVFAEGLAIVHYGNIVVSPFSKIGRNCRIHVGVNIGGAGGIISENEAKSMSPIIGDNCYIGPGAKIYGPITLGDNCVIGANAVVGRSFPQGEQTIAGIPAKVVASRGSKGQLIEGWSRCE